MGYSTPCGLCYISYTFFCLNKKMVILLLNRLIGGCIWFKPVTKLNWFFIREWFPLEIYLCGICRFLPKRSISYFVLSITLFLAEPILWRKVCKFQTVVLFADVMWWESQEHIFLRCNLSIRTNAINLSCKEWIRAFCYDLVKKLHAKLFLLWFFGPCYFYYDMCISLGNQNVNLKRNRFSLA